MPAQYFLGSRLLGVTNIVPKWDDATPLQFNAALFCPTCGEIWARVTSPLADQWLTQHRLCARHPEGGSFASPWRSTASVLQELPPEVLLYEVILRLTKDFPNELPQSQDPALPRYPGL